LNRRFKLKSSERRAECVGAAQERLAFGY